MVAKVLPGAVSATRLTAWLHSLAAHLDARMKTLKVLPVMAIGRLGYRPLQKPLSCMLAPKNVDSQGPSLGIEPIAAWIGWKVFFFHAPWP